MPVTAPLHDHLIALGEGWSLWRSCCVRGAGFPVAGVLELIAPAAAAIADRLAGAEALKEQERARAVQVCKTLPSTAASDEATAIKRALKRLYAHEVPPVGGSPAVEQALAPLRAAQAEAQRLREDGARTLASERQRLSDRLRAHAADPRLREAVLWQNRGAVHNTLDGLVRSPPGSSDRETRKREAVVATYLQRYCTKNDTIGFFGPVGWGRLDGDGPAMAVRPGPSLCAERRVYFEHWCVDALAEALADDAALRLQLAPRRAPALRVEEDRLFFNGRPLELPRAYEAVLLACDGRTPARELAARLEPELEEDVAELLAELHERRLVRWTLEVPTVDLHPEARLRERLAALEGEPRTRALAALDSLEHARVEIAAAAADPDRLDRAIGALQTEFERLTRASATRRGGATYAARTLFFEECRRDLELTVGPGLRAKMAAPLALVLQIARWYTFTIAQRYRRHFASVCRRLAPAGEPIDYVLFHAEAIAEFSGDPRRPPPFVAETLAELQRRFAALIAVDGEPSRVALEAEAVAARVREQFAAPHPGWPSARLHSLDLLLAAPSVQAIAAGEVLLIMGELHTGHSSLTGSLLAMHPDPASLIRAHERDVPIARIAPVIPKERVLRTSVTPHTALDYDLEVGATRSWRAPDRVRAAADWVVEGRGDDVVVRTRDGALRFDALQFFEQFLIVESFGHFVLLPAAPHTPRVTLDELVVSRETWRFPSSALPFLGLGEPFDRFAGARQWAQAHRLPRWLFVKIPEETKPCYLDLESPMYVELFIKLARQASSITLSEMLPSPLEAWLPDADGATYTCELRMVAVDPEEWR
jgi:hypothetical protein